MRGYFLILLAATYCMCAFTCEEEGQLAAFLRIRAQAVCADVTFRRVILAIGVLLIACLVWQVAGFDFAFVFGGEVLTYIEIVAAIFFAAARTRVKRTR